MTENETRQWIVDILNVVKKGCSLTDTTIDDSAVLMVINAVNNDTLWVWIWKLIGRFMEDDGALVGDVEAPSEAALVGVNPLLIIAVIRALVALWKSFQA